MSSNSPRLHSLLSKVGSTKCQEKEEAWPFRLVTSTLVLCGTAAEAGTELLSAPAAPGLRAGPAAHGRGRSNTPVRSRPFPPRSPCSEQHVPSSPPRGLTAGGWHGSRQQLCSKSLDLPERTTPSLSVRRFGLPPSPHPPRTSCQGKWTASRQRWIVPPSPSSRSSWSLPPKAASYVFFRQALQEHR